MNIESVKIDSIVIDKVVASHAGAAWAISPEGWIQGFRQHGENLAQYLDPHRRTDLHLDGFTYQVFFVIDRGPHGNPTALGIAQVPQGSHPDGSHPENLEPAGHCHIAFHLDDPTQHAALLAALDDRATSV